MKRYVRVQSVGRYMSYSSKQSLPDRRSIKFNLNFVKTSVRPTRDVIFRKMTNQNQTDTNEMATIETKYQTDFYSAENTNI